MFSWMNLLPSNILASFTERPICTWSAHVPQSGPSPSPFPRHSHTLTATATAAGELFLFGGSVHWCASSDLHVISIRDFSTTLLQRIQTRGEVPGPRYGHGAALTSTKLLIYGGISDQHVVDHDSLYFLNLGTLDLLMPSSTPVDHSFVLQYRGSGPALWSMVPGRAVVPTKPQLWSVPSSSSSVVRLAERSSMICGHSIRTVVRLPIQVAAPSHFDPIFLQSNRNLFGSHMNPHPETRSPLRGPITFQ